MLQEKIEGPKPETGAISPHIHYQRVVYDVLSTLWARASLIGAGLMTALALVSVVLVLIGPHYTSRAMIQFKFVREEPAKDSKIATTATVDATAVLNDAAPIIRSHAVAGAVVAKLGLDKDPTFAHGAVLWRFLSGIRSHLGYDTTGPSSRDLAEEQLIRQITVASDPRSYLVSISVTALDPERAAELANAVALEYLRGQLLQQLSESYAASEREISGLASIYGARHPAYRSEQTRLEGLRVQLEALRKEPFDEAVANRVAGQSFVAAQKVMVPSGPNILLILGLTAVTALGIGGWLALQPWAIALPNIASLRKLRCSLPVPARLLREPLRRDGLVAGKLAKGAEDHIDHSSLMEQDCSLEHLVYTDGRNEAHHGSEPTLARLLQGQ